MTKVPGTSAPDRRRLALALKGFDLVEDRVQRLRRERRRLVRAKRSFEHDGLLLDIDQRLDHEQRNLARAIYLLEKAGMARDVWAKDPNNRQAGLCLARTSARHPTLVRAHWRFVVHWEESYSPERLSIESRVHETELSRRSREAVVGAAITLATVLVAVALARLGGHPDLVDLIPLTAVPAVMAIRTLYVTVDAGIAYIRFSRPGHIPAPPNPTAIAQPAVRP